jgi:L-threonylcarbamoyladenylate synthase
MLRRHYAPETPLRLVDAHDLEAEAGGTAAVGALLFRARPEAALAPFAAVEVLSAHGDLREAAANFFAALRRLDRLGLSAIVAERVPDRGLGRAINDRLRRGSAR